MGVVHLALDAHGRAVAIKVLRPHVAYDAEARWRLRARGRHPHPHPRAPGWPPLSTPTSTGDRPYLVTRYVAGPSLDDVVTDEGPLDPDELVRLGRGLVEALQAIHGVGVVHRDLKPGNVLLEDGEPVVIDFGIAHIADDVRLTSSGLVMGTPGYLSPRSSGARRSPRPPTGGDGRRRSPSRLRPAPVRSRPDGRRPRPRQRGRDRSHRGRPSTRASAPGLLVSQSCPAPPRRRGDRRVVALRRGTGGHRAQPKWWPLGRPVARRPATARLDRGLPTAGHGGLPVGRRGSPPARAVAPCRRRRDRRGGPSHASSNRTGQGGTRSGGARPATPPRAWPATGGGATQRHTATLKSKTTVN